jgi:flagellar protein FlgJ
MSLPDISQQFSLDVSGLAALKRGARDNSPEALKATAQQFEALFLQMVLKSMRDATPQDGMLDSDQSRMYQSLFDQQLVQKLTSKGSGTGLAALIEKQLSRQSQEPQAQGALPLSPLAPPLPLQQTQPSIPLSKNGSSAPAGTAGSVSAAAGDFVARVWPEAFEASRATGIPAQFMVAQAALETRWGQSEPRHPDGTPSYNLFGIKAGRSWNGAVVSATTSEYVDGTMQKQQARFRAYGSYAEAFRDYAHLLISNPRYASVVGSQDAQSFARGLQQAGYATDPMYAAKLTRIIGGAALRGGLAGYALGTASSQDG